MFEAPYKKLTIASLDDSTLQVVAQYNPKELDFAMQVGWKDDSARAKLRDRDRIDGVAQFEYTGSEARTLALELLFDGLEEDRSVEPIVDHLEELAAPGIEDKTCALKQRPHRCLVVWNEREQRPFQCVIETLGVKYVMFAYDGRPVRAVCTLKLKEANALARW